MTRPHTQAAFLRGARATLRAVFLFLLPGLAAAASAPAKRATFDIPASAATEAFKQFAAQAGVQLLYATEAVEGVKTNAVKGELTPREAIDRMLAGTVLAAQQTNNGAISVRREGNDPNAQRAAPAANGDRPTRASAARSNDDGTIALSPFTVNEDKDNGYAATSTLAGSRLNTALKDTPAAISVFTKDFLEDIGALNVAEALNYAMNTERDFSDFTGNVFNAVDVTFQMRGFVGASLGRNYFTWFGATDSYNIERLDFSRGPNSILFGIGGPGGIVNTTTKQARIGRDRTEAQLRVGSWDDHRATLDVNRSLGSKLAVRANAIWQERKSWREFEYYDRLGGAFAATYRPFRNTTIRIDSEYADVKENRAQPWPAADRLSPWLNAGSPISQTFGQVVPGTGSSTSRAYVYDPLSGVGPVVLFGSRTTSSGPSAVGLANNPIAITDERLLPRSTNLAGPSFVVDNNFYNYAAFIEQRVVENLDVELAFNRQHERRYGFRPIVFDGVALRGDPNAFLPDGRPNPNVGRYYVEGTAQLEVRDQVRDDYRATASYALDLTRRNKWLGRHRFAGLLSRRNNVNQTPGTFAERNLTPAGDALYPRDLTSGNNAIVRRSYLDFSTGNSDYRGLHDVRRHPVNQNGIQSGFVRTGDSARDELTRIDSMMIAAQSAFWNDRLWLTGGLRHDKQRAWGSGGATQDPVTRLWGLRTRNATYTLGEGDTQTYGAVLHATEWLSFYYNNANNFNPNSARSDLIDGGLIGHRIGEGQDAGIKLRLLNNKVNVNLGWYETLDTNRQVGIDNNWFNHINAIWRTLGQPERQINVYADTQDLAGKGYELEVTANFTSNWRTSFNWSITDQITTNQQPRTVAYVAEHLPTWQANAGRDLDRTGTSLTAPTVGVAIQNAQFILDTILAGNGNVRRGLREHAGNVFTNYTFARDSRLKGFSVGAGANYRGKNVVGYDSSRGNAPIYGNEFILVNAMVRYGRKLGWRNTDWRVQVNVDNLLGEHDLQVTDADQNRPYRYVYQTPRRWSVSSTFAW